MPKRYQQILKDLTTNIFLSDTGDNRDNLIKLTADAVDDLVVHQGTGPLYPVFSPKKISEVVSEAEIPTSYNFNHEELLGQLHVAMQRSVKANSPYMVKNIIPQPSFIFLAAYQAVSLYMGNAVTGEDAGEALKAELACASAIAKLAGMDPSRASGVFTFGGTGTNFYALKVGLAKTAPEHLLEGLTNNNIVAVGNQASHYSQQTAANWLGIGQDNYIHVKTNTNQTTNLDDLDATCRRLLKEGKKLACIEAVGGTTSNMAIDDLEAIHTMRERWIEEFKLTYTPHLHADSVLGWAWLNFVGYDFVANPLGFDSAVLAKIKRNADLIAKLRFADSFGVDFHKSGFMPYTSSMIIFKDKDDFNLLKRQKDIMTPLFHDDDEYNPGIYTLETSRSTATILASWTTLKSFGQEGYQVLLGHGLAMRQLFVDAHDKLKAAGLIIENVDACAADVFIRCFKAGTDVVKEHEAEMTDEVLLKKNTQITSDFFKWFTTIHQGPNPEVAVSKSSASFYNHNGSPVVALRFYLLSMNHTEETVKFLIRYLLDAKNEFDKTYTFSA